MKFARQREEKFGKSMFLDYKILNTLVPVKKSHRYFHSENLAALGENFAALEENFTAKISQRAAA